MLTRVKGSKKTRWQAVYFIRAKKKLLEVFFLLGFYAA
jgi:hypothetical protein